MALFLLNKSERVHETTKGKIISIVTNLTAASYDGAAWLHVAHCMRSVAGNHELLSYNKQDLQSN